MRKSVAWACLGACAVVIAAGCGSSGGNGATFGDDGGGSRDVGVSSSSSGGDDSASSSGGDDATLNDTGSGGGPIDASLDIQFPDSFFGPDVDAGTTPETGGGGGPSCSPDGVTCQGNTEYDCSGGSLSVTDCTKLTPAQTCANGYGCVVCQPGTGSCSGNTGTQCNPNGSGYTTNNCDPALGETCNGATGQCAGDCANLGASYIGCEYYAVTMSNTQLDQTAFQFSVSISNTTAKQASIVITGPGYNQTAVLGANAIQNYVLPWVSALSTNNTTHLVAGGAYHIKSTEPITVYEFNAYDYQRNVSCSSDPNGSPPCHSYTNDASLLIPVNALTGNYYVMAGATWGFNNPSVELPGTVAIVATVNGTSVKFGMASGSIQPGGGLNTGSGGTVTLNQGDVLEVSSALDAPQPGFGSDMSGASVTASQPVMVIGGSDCSFMPAGNWACDHLEQINFPLETLRSDYLVTLPWNNNGTPRQFVKIVGTATGTTLVTSPTQAGLPASIGAGQVVFFETTQNFHLTSSKPVIVGQFMEGQYQFGSACNQAGLAGPPDCGDPSMSLTVATQQFRSSYQFIAPPSYYENWVNVIAPTGASVTVDGNAVGGFVAIGNSGYSVAHPSLCGNGTCTGVHTATSTVPFGIEVYGYGYFTSYMYPGGLNLARQ